MSGIDKAFDYIVPDVWESRATVGAAVRVVLHHRKVGGWVIARSDQSQGEFEIFDRSRLVPLSSVSGNGVDPSVIDLAHWAARYYGGSLRSVLKSASAPRMREVPARAQYSSRIEVKPDGTAKTVDWSRAVQLCAFAPAQSVLPLVVNAVSDGPVLLLCPTQRMVRLGAAWLRRRGCTVAEYPNEWGRAAGGVDVVIGTRSAVWAPCPSLRTIVIIDEHDETFAEERVPSWNARDVAVERARRGGARVLLSSGVPSLASLARYTDEVSSISIDGRWPSVEIVNLNDDEVVGGVLSSLLSTSLIEVVRDAEKAVAVVINTKVRARRIACKSCRDLQSCPTCASLLAFDHDKKLTCARCAETHGTVCLSCGRTTLSVLRPGVAHLAEELAAGAARPVVQVTADDDLAGDVAADVYVGTEAVLHRLQSAEVVVFADFDSELMSSRLSTQESAWSLMAKAARLVGKSGRVIVQTRQPHHPVVTAMQRLSRSEGTSYLEWARDELRSRRQFGLPPYAVAAHLEGVDASMVHAPTGLRLADFGDHVLLTAPTHAELLSGIEEIRNQCSERVRVVIDPVRI